MAKSPNRSIRAPEDFWAQLDAFAAANNMKPGPALVHAARAWIERGEPGHVPTTSAQIPAPKAVLAKAEASAAHLAKPKPKISERQREWRAALRGVSVGPVARPPGSMLKATKKGPRR